MRLFRRCSPLAVVLAVAALAGTTVAAPAIAAPDRLASVTVTGGPDEKPVVALAKPVSVKSTTAKVVTKGDGEKAKLGSTITIDYLFVDGRTGAELGSSYGQATKSLPLDRTRVQPVIVDNLVGARVGSRVVIAIAPKEGMAKAFASDTIKKSDTVLFVADIRGAHAPLERATGAAVAPVDGLPTVKLAKNGAPTITMPKTAAPTALVAQPLITGTGPVVQTGQTISVQYTGAIWDSGKVFDSSWKTGKPVQFPIGNGSVIKGWDDGLVGQTVGSQVLLVIPPDEGYGASGSSGAGIKGTDTIVFVVDILDAT
ncbi:MAG: FKBP-type peptidyl-prolyl cis-trans isomerase [Acidimicrobiia bacterium]